MSHTSDELDFGMGRATQNPFFGLLQRLDEPCPDSWADRLFMHEVVLEATEAHYKDADGFDEELVTLSLATISAANNSSTVSSNSSLCPICFGFPRNPVIYCKPVDI